MARTPPRTIGQILIGMLLFGNYSFIVWQVQVHSTPEMSYPQWARETIWLTRAPPRSATLLTGSESRTIPDNLTTLRESLDIHTLSWYCMDKWEPASDCPSMHAKSATPICLDILQNRILRPQKLQFLKSRKINERKGLGMGFLRPKIA